MLPAARVAAAIEVLDLILDGSSAEKALTGWGRSHRFAGSKDRAAIRDHVFGALRCRASYGWVGGAETGRGIMLGAARLDGSVDATFTGEGHAPRPVDADEIGQELAVAPRDVRLDLPVWMLAHFDAACGAQADRVLACLQSRAGVFLRVNLSRTTRSDVAAQLAQDGITTAPLDHVKTALQVIDNERRVAQSKPYLDGLIELQDPSSQAAIVALELAQGTRVLDFCAGGGGKALAMVDFGAKVSAHDIDPRRMIDLEPRAMRAGVAIETLESSALADVAPFELVFCDAPCSGSGTWRRTPCAKWDLTPERLSELGEMQDQVLTSAAPLVALGGRLVYATCSVFECENIERVQLFMGRSSSFQLVSSHATLPHDFGDGFFYAVLERTN